MSGGRERWAYALFGVAMTLAVVAVAGALLVDLGSDTARSSFLVTNTAIGVSCAPCGLLIARAKPTNPIGWLFLGLGVAPLVTAATVPLAQHGMSAGWSEATMRLLITVFTLAWPWGAMCCLPLALQLFPDGRPLSPRWHWLTYVTVASPALYILGTGPTPELGASTYLQPPGYEVLAGVAGPLTSAVLLASVGSVIVRYHRGDDTTRQQLLWLLLATVVAIGLNLPWSATEPVGDGIWLILAIPLIPVAVTIAVLRHGMFDVRLVVSRTLLYAVLTIAVVGAYVALVALLDRVLRGVGGPVLATLLIALAFNPARVRLQQVVDRALYGSRRDPVHVIASVGRRLAGEDLAGVLDGVRDALKLPFASLRIASREVAASGEPPATLHAVPLVYGGERVGELVVGPRRGERRLAATDTAVLELLATPLAIALHATALTEDLQTARERLVLAVEDERRRLHRELHDSLGPELTGAALKADAVANLGAVDPAAATRLAVELGEQIREAIRDVRRLVYGLRPPALDEVGLVEALRRQGAQLAPLAVEIDAPQPLALLPAAVEVAAYRIVTEALTNVVRHSPARHALVVLRTTAAELQVSVTDDGPSAGPWPRGVGLRSLTERAAELGGSCEAGPTLSGGRVSAILPLRDPVPPVPPLVRFPVGSSR